LIISASIILERHVLFGIKLYSFKRTVPVTCC
jgi:hypothetical protein